MSNNYWDYSLKFNKREIDLRQKFMDWLPDNIIDCHCHVNLPEFSNSISERSRNHMAFTFENISLLQSSVLNNLLFPEKNVKKLFFPYPFLGIDYVGANKYLFDNVDSGNKLAVFGIPSNSDYVIKMINEKKFSAVKMYHASTNPISLNIYQFFTRDILEEAQSLKIPIILHLPISISKSISDLLLLLKDFPELIVVLAHLGLPDYDDKHLEDIYKKLSVYENLFMDTSMVTSYLPIYFALKYFGEERIMFGSDEPINMIRGVKYCHPKLGQRVVSEFKYHWLNDGEFNDFKHLSLNSTHFHWQSLSAIKMAIEKNKSNNNYYIRENVFCVTAKNVYKF
ncbi:MAG: amidohydrolase family protein [Candidatus Falkowbacteria bacterium]